MNGLSEEEWSDVLASLPENLDETAEGWELSLVRRTVERLVAARLASVEALADEWERESRRIRAAPVHFRGLAEEAEARAKQLRAVLGSDAHTDHITRPGTRPVLVVDPAEARETIAAPIALARCQDVHANDTGNACRACQSFAQVVALRVLAALGSQGEL